MGCTQSKIENEEAVTRCKERSEFMKKAVRARNEFASAHSAFTVALKNTGAALSDYAEAGDLLQGSQSTGPPPPVDPLPPPPPPPIPTSTPPLLRAVSMPELVRPPLESKHTDTIQEEEDDEEEEETESPHHNLSHHRHHRSASSRGGGGGRVLEEVEVVLPPPPSLPRPPPSNPVAPPPPPPPDAKESTWDYFFDVDPNMTGSSLSQQENNDNHSLGHRHSHSQPFSGTGTVYDDQRYNERLKRTEKIDIDVNVASTSSSNSKVEIHTEEEEEEEEEEEKVIETEAVKPMKKEKMVQPVPVEIKRGGSVTSLSQILNELDDKFLKASQSAYEVSKILEANRMHYHSNFADNRGNIDHSARLMRVITWNRSFKGLQTTNDANDDDFDKNESLASVLDKLLAWEKKLYDEVKAGELMKIAYQRKVALVNKRERRGTQSEALERAKAAVSHLHTRYIVDMQSMDSTVSEITHLRDDHLYPKLVFLVDGMARMWENMHAQHGAQMKIVEDLRSLDASYSPSETSEEHHTRTVQLMGAAGNWHSQFRKVVMHQKDYILNLNSWLKLNLISVESNLKEKVSSPPRVQRPPIHVLLQVWHEKLEKLPSEVAGSAIASFQAIMKNIKEHQDDEFQLRKTCNDTRKELARRTREFEDWYQKHMEGGVPPDGTIGDVNKKDPLGEKQFVIENLKTKLKEEEEAYVKHCRLVREKSLASLKIHLPELFQATSEFASAAATMYKKLVPLTQSQKQSESLS